jgi:flagellar motor switch protein FliG|tara:strand:+ start:7601 stop:8614 length:1014 start_codon:yes stop_codon:yes gene_type:complete
MADAAGAGLSGAQRAAVFLLGVGEESATAIMRHMEPREVQRIGEAMASLASISNEQVEAVLAAFHEDASALNPLGLGAPEFTRRVLTNALGESKARSMLAKVMPGKQQTSGIEALKWMDPGAVAELLEDEHPQIIAIVLASLDEEQSAQVLVNIPEPVRSEALLRVARLQVIDPAAMEELDKVLEKQLGKVRKTPPRSVNGMTSAAAILNNVKADVESELLGALKEADAELGEKVGELMFVFDNLMELDDRGMQRLIREIAVDSLVIALKGVDDRLQDKFFNNMSSRAADMLREDLEAKGPVKLSEVEAAQKEILAVAGRLSDEGEITLGKGGDDFV